MMNWDTGSMGAGWTALMLLAMLAFWAVCAVAIVWFVRPAPTPAFHRDATAGAEQVLAERLARGEIAPREYQARMAALRDRSTA